jgi:glutathione transport system substrate-binding protein
MAFIRKTLLVVGFLTLLVVPAAFAQSQLTVLQAEPPRSMDPANQTANQTASVLYPMYEGLVQRTEKQDLAPDLATKWESNADGTVWTFTIRKGVTFHDGTALTPEAVVASFDRLLNPKAGLAGAARFQDVINSAKVVGNDQVQFNLKNPYPAFLALLAESQAGIVSPTAAKNGTLDRKADGTGPYKFVEWDTGERVVMEANKNYWGNVPKVDRLVWTWSAEPSVMSMSLQSGTDDIVSPLPPVYAKTFTANPQFTLMQEPGSAVFWVALDVQLAPLNDVRVRQALNYATNRKALVDSLLHGYGTPANSPLAPPDFGYDASIKGYSYNPEKAKKLLAEAGYKDGFTINLALQEKDKAIGTALQAMWAKVGVKLNLQVMESGVWTAAAFGTPKQKKQQKIGAVFASWSSNTLDADGQLRPLYDTASWAPKSANLGFYSNSKLDTILDKAASITDTSKRKALYKQAQEIINEDAPMVLLYYPTALAARRSNVGGIRLAPGNGLRIRNPTIKQ